MTHHEARFPTRASAIATKTRTVAVIKVFMLRSAEEQMKV
jgi:hypothetical protein